MASGVRPGRLKNGGKSDWRQIIKPGFDPEFNAEANGMGTRIIAITFLYICLTLGATVSANQKELQQERIVSSPELYYTQLIESGNLDGLALANAYSNRGETFRRNKMYENAIQDFNMALSIDPTNQGGLINRSNYFADTGNFDSALEDINAAIANSDSNWIAYTTRGSIHSAIGNVEEALNDYSKAIEINPQCEMCYFNRGTLLLRIGSPDKAIDDLSLAIKIGNNFRSFQNRAVANRQTGKFAQAQADYLHALELNPYDGDVLNGYAWFLATSEDSEFFDPQKAIDLAQKALHLCGADNLNTLHTLAIAHSRAGNRENAITTLKTAIVAAKATKNKEFQEKLENELSAIE